LSVFFYGLFMDAAVLRSHGVAPSEAGIAFVADHAVRLGAKAMLLPAPGQRAWGLLYALTRAELDALYANVPGYREVACTAHRLNGAVTPAVSMVHTHPPIDSAEDLAYAAKWKVLVQRLGLPLDSDMPQ
jgi:hypothetical protein